MFDTAQATPELAQTLKQPHDQLLGSIARGDELGSAEALRAGADPNATCAEGSVIHAAALSTYASLTVLRQLRAMGADLTATDSSGSNALAIIPRSGAPTPRRIARALYFIRHGAALDAPNHRGMQPLHHAARYRDAALVTLYLVNGANANVKDHQQRTPLHWLLEFSTVYDQEVRRCVEQLVAAGANLAECTGEWPTPEELLHRSIKEPTWFAKLEDLGKRLPLHRWLAKHPDFEI